MNRKPLFIALAITAAGAQAEWTNTEFFALSDTTPVVGVSYYPSNNCRWAMLSIGDESVTSIAILVDGKAHGTYRVEPIVNTAEGIEIGPDVISAMKRGKAMVLVTDHGALDVSLKGATRAINANHAKCKSGW